MNVRFFTRSEWGAAAPQKRAPFTIPAASRRGVVIHHNGPPMAGLIDTPEKSLDYVRAIQRYHQQTNGWSDVAYSFLFDNFGQVFECRGWAWDQFANGDDVVGEFDGADTVWYTAMWMGGKDDVPSPAAYDAAKFIVSAARFLGSGQKVLPHNYFQIKSCPGPQFTAWCMQHDERPFEEPKPEPAPALVLPNSDEEEDMRIFVKDNSGAIYELVQPLVGVLPSGRLIPGKTMRRHIAGAEWRTLRHVYESRLVDVSVEDVSELEAVA
jgi:hypothetical protein